MRLHWKTTLRLAPVLALTGGVILAAASTIAGDSQRVAAQSGMEYRVFGPQVACDSCVDGGGSPTLTPTATATTGTGTPDTDTPTPTPTEGTPTATSTPTVTTPTVTPTPTTNPDPTCQGGFAEITGLSKTTNPESVTISGSGNLSGWYIDSANGAERFTFPEGFVLDGEVEIHSGSFATGNAPGTLLWTTEEVWENSADDDAFLFNCDGFFRSTFDDGE